MIDPFILAGAPAHLALDPSIYRVGMLLFRKGSPGIVAHLVETPAMGLIGQQIGSVALTSANPVLSMATSAVGHAATNFQLAKIRQVLGVIENLQLANLAVTAIHENRRGHFGISHRRKWAGRRRRRGASL